MKSMLCSSVAAIALCATAAPALAQQSPDESAGGGFGEIVVTAQKREENLQEVPLSISVIGGEQLGKTGALTLGAPDGSAATPVGESNIEAIGALLYGRYLFLFEAAGIILLVAMIGAIVLTHRTRRGVRGQNVGRQIARRPDEATVNTRPEVGKGVQL